MKDARGRYLCEHAFTTMKQARTQGVEITHERMWCADAKREDRDAAQREEEHAGAAPVTVAPIGLADDDGGPDLTSLAELEAASGPAIGESQTGSSCPKCGGFMAVSAVICTSCGFNAATGKAAKTMTGKEADKSEKKSKRGKKRPEEMSDRELADWETSREVVRKAYMTPIVIFLICSGLTMAIYASVGGAFGGLSILGLMLDFAITAPITIATFYLCAVLFIGFDEPFLLMCIRMAAVLAATYLAEAAGYALNAHTPGLGMILWLVPWFVYVATMVTLMELDIADALIVGFVSGFVKLIAGMFLVAWVISLIASGAGGLMLGGGGAPAAVGSWDESPGYFVDGDGDTLDDYTDLPQADYDLWLEDTGGERSPFEWLYGDFDTGNEEP
ncbi:MAG: hypothetical protein AAF138_02290 [Planctomycetota bacterium]